MSEEKNEREAISRRLLALVDMDRLRTEIAAARQSDAWHEATKHSDDALAEWLVLEAAAMLPGLPVTADLHLVVHGPVNIWDGRDEDGSHDWGSEGRTRLCGEVQLESGRRIYLDIAWDSREWCSECETRDAEFYGLLERSGGDQDLIGGLLHRMWREMSHAQRDALLDSDAADSIRAGDEASDH